jgi:hypothetical protein
MPLIVEDDPKPAGLYLKRLPPPGGGKSKA